MTRNEAIELLFTRATTDQPFTTAAYNAMCEAREFLLATLSFTDLRETNVQRCQKGFGHALDSWSVAEWGNATAGELGEACNVAKKLLRVRDEIKGNKETETDLRAKLAREMADAVIYLDLWAASQGIDLAQAVRESFNAKSVEIGAKERL